MCVCVLHNQGFLAVLLHAESDNIKQMCYTFVCAFDGGPKHVGGGVLYNIIVILKILCAFVILNGNN
jgi:hypothetical protein